MQGCLKSIWNFIIFIVVIFAMGALSIVNLVFTNALGETCGIVHPYIFQIDVSSIDVQTGTKANAYENTIPTSGTNASFDSVLRVYDDDGVLIESNDDFGEGLTSRIEGFPIGRYGTIVVEVATFDDAGSGEYNLTIKASENQAIGNAFVGLINGQEVRSGQVFNGELAVGGHNTYTLSASQPVNIFLFGTTSDDEVGEYELDTYLSIYDEAGNIIVDNDDIDSETRSSGIDSFPVQEFGTVTIDVTTYDESFAGNYTLVIAPLDADLLALLGYETVDEESDDVSVQSAELNGNAANGNIEAGERVSYTVSRQSFGVDAIDIRLDGAGKITNLESDYLFVSDNPSAPLQWISCVEHYGYVDGTSFTLNQRGMDYFGQGTLCDPSDEGCSIVSRINLNFFGQMLFYLILPGFVILLPIIGVFAIRDEKSTLLWIVMLMFVALHVLTSSLLYVHLATVSGVEALANFAYGILAGAATGSAIAFMGKVLENFSSSNGS